MFVPPHCPNPKCHHFKHPHQSSWYSRISPYHTKTFGLVPRFRCRSCRKTFSKQTFSIHYYAKKEIDLHFIHSQINAGAGIRNIARGLHISPRTVTNRINRLARNALIIHQETLDTLKNSEDFAADGFESYCVSQYFPDNYTILVGSESQFVYSCHYATLRRKGRMTVAQKRKRQRIERTFRPSPKALEVSFRDLLLALAHRTGDRERPIILYTDEKKEYQRALWRNRLCRSRLFDGRWRHHCVNSREARHHRNPLFPVNYMDREIRKDMANHTRESVQFSRNVNEAMMRMSVYLFDHNFVKPYRVAHRERRRFRHAQVAGLDRGVLDEMVRGFLSKRCLWRGDHPMEDWIVKTLNREWVTPLKRRDEVVWKHMAA